MSFFDKENNMKKIVSLKTYKKYLIDFTDSTTDYALRKFLINDIGPEKLQNIIDTTSAFAFYMLNWIQKNEKFLQADKNKKITVSFRMRNPLILIQNGTIDWPADYWMHPVLLPEDILISEHLLTKFFKVKYCDYDYKKIAIEQSENERDFVFYKLKYELEKLIAYYGYQEEEEIKRILKM